MADSSVCFLFNSYANSGKLGKTEQQIREFAQTHWPDARFIKTGPGPGFWQELPADLAGVSTIVACGGDGTVHRAGNLALNLNAELGIIPIGSGNDFAYMMGIPSKLPAALNLLTQSRRRDIDVVEIDGDISCYCLNTAGIGLDGMANFYTDTYKRTLGKAGYIAGALKALYLSSSMDLKLLVDGKPINAPYLMVTICNGKREGGQFNVAPQAEPDDGIIDLLLLDPMNCVLRLVALQQFLADGPGQTKGCKFLKCNSFTLQSDKPAYIHVDGEYSGEKIRKLEMRIIPSALRVIA